VSNAPSKPVSFSRPKVGYFSNRPRIVCSITIMVIQINVQSLRKNSRFEKETASLTQNKTSHKTQQVKSSCAQQYDSVVN